MAMPSHAHLDWAASAVAPDAAVVDAIGLHDGGSPWRLDIRAGERTVQAILRVADWGRIWGVAIATAAAGLEVAATHDLPTARLIASDVDGAETGECALLETSCAGTSTPPGLSALHSAGAALAQVHAIRMTPTERLPLRLHHNPYDDYPAERRWARRYRCAAVTERGAVVDELIQRCSWFTRESAVESLESTPTSPLLEEADDILRDLAPPDAPTVFVHADVWFGNMLWDDTQCLGLIDWKACGVGDPGVDLSNLRMQAAFSYGAEGTAAVTAGWQDAMGRAASSLAYWDAVSALNTPAGYGATRDAFLAEALGRLS